MRIDPGRSTPKENILLTGRPRVGKSTLVRSVIERLRGLGVTKMGGFYTLEVAQGGSRIGFDIHTLDGRIGPLARVGLESRHRLGRYGIDMEKFESVAVTALEEAIGQGGLVVIDEIGYMELKSRRFRERVQEALRSPAPVLATIMRNRFEFPDAIKARGDVLLIYMTVENRSRLVNEIVERLQKRL